MARKRFAVFVVLLYVATAAAQGRWVTKEYRNSAEGFAVRIPAGMASFRLE